MFRLKIKLIFWGALLLLGAIVFVIYPKVNKLIFHLPESINMSEEVETSLKSHLFEISGSSKIVLASLKHYEIFERKSELSLFNDRLKLPDIIVRASMPVEYNYFVEFDERWIITTHDNSLRLVVPMLRPMRPAVNISEIEFEVKKDSIFRRDSIVSEQLRLELDKLLEKSAMAHMLSVREIARLELKKIVELWAASSGAKFDIEILFEDEIDTEIY